MSSPSSSSSSTGQIPLRAKGIKPNGVTPQQLVQRMIPSSSSSSPSNPGGYHQPISKFTITHTKDWWSFISEVVIIGGSLAALGYMFNALMKQNDPENNGSKRNAENFKQKVITKLNSTGRRIRSFPTTSYEDSLLNMIVLPNEIQVRFHDIGGLKDVKTDIMESVLVPLMYPRLTSSSKLCAPPLGVLFYGAPGTGKSMMAKAIARETNATFFNLDLSKLMSKWYGDSQKMISALFSLAKKTSPSIIWIDEIDALFSTRGGGGSGGGGPGGGGGGSGSEHQADIYNKALFLSLWDGLVEDSNQGVLILGATNRPQAVDEAFLRRMSRQYAFAMPDLKTRQIILTIFLKTEKVDKNVNLAEIAKRTEGYSGSDLKEVCKYAATLPLRQYLRELRREHVRRTTNGQGKTGDRRTNTTGDGDKGMVIDLDGEDSTNETMVKGDGGMTDDGISAEYTRYAALNEWSPSFELRAIAMSDFEIALGHVKSTARLHREHEARARANRSYYSMFSGLSGNSLNGGFDMSAYLARTPGRSSGSSSLATNGDKRKKPTVDERDENEDDEDGVDTGTTQLFESLD